MCSGMWLGCLSKESMSMKDATMGSVMIVQPKLLHATRCSQNVAHQRLSNPLLPDRKAGWDDLLLPCEHDKYVNASTVLKRQLPSVYASSYNDSHTNAHMHAMTYPPVRPSPPLLEHSHAHAQAHKSTHAHMHIHTCTCYTWTHAPNTYSFWWSGFSSQVAPFP